MVAKGDSNPGSLDCESGILPLRYCIAGPAKRRHVIYSPTLDVVCPVDGSVMSTTRDPSVATDISIAGIVVARHTLSQNSFGST